MPRWSASLQITIRPLSSFFALLLFICRPESSSLAQHFIAVFITCGLLWIATKWNNSLPLIIRKLKRGCLRYLGVVSDVSAAVFAHRRGLSPYTSSRIDPDTVRVKRQRRELPDRADCVISWNKFQSIRWHSAFDGLFFASSRASLIKLVFRNGITRAEPNRTGFGMFFSGGIGMQDNLKLKRRTRKLSERAELQ